MSRSNVHIFWRKISLVQQISIDLADETKGAKKKKIHQVIIMQETIPSAINKSQSPPSVKKFSPSSVSITNQVSSNIRN